MSESATKSVRYRSLDIFRGATVALMIVVNNPGTWSAMYPPLQHAKWHGCTPTDLVFPFFLFAVGNALAFVMEKLRSSSPLVVWRKILLRTIFIFLIGLFLNAYPFVAWQESGSLGWKSFDTLRIFGVLQRIALSFGGAAAIVYLFAKEGKTHRVLAVTVAMLVGYWILCLLAGDSQDPFSLEGFVGTALDRKLWTPNHLYKGEGVPFDPEGLLSTIPSIAQVLLGWWVGITMLRSTKELALIGRLAVMGIHLLAIAYVWQWVFPLNKKIWTSTFTLHTSGLAILTVLFIVYWSELAGAANGTGGGSVTSRVERGFQKLVGLLFRFFEVFGKNPLFLFVLSGLLPKTLGLIRWTVASGEGGETTTVTPMPWIYRTFFRWEGWDPRLGSFLYSLCLLLIFWCIAVWLDRRKIYIKV